MTVDMDHHMHPQPGDRFFIRGDTFVDILDVSDSRTHVYMGTGHPHIEGYRIPLPSHWKYGWNDPNFIDD